MYPLQAGVYYFQLIDWYCAMYSVPVIGLLECTSIAYIYGEWIDLAFGKLYINTLNIKMV